MWQSFLQFNYINRVYVYVDFKSELNKKSHFLLSVTQFIININL